ncbi:hypothetical protein T10_2451 [Trichinella papuae]|uniref:Uncharacterized protein n=1 Tax=Trichinella papuae TaxID=268474 RepID=A0A0V1N0W3_9BILA|nr:hypothetical protein T10_2451 [Trichinella papuae]
MDFSHPVNGINFKVENVDLKKILIQLPEEETSTFAHTCQAANQLIRLRIDHLIGNKDEAND